jgi:GPH family glycoside/pentoside/hexuronide:cation symporter
MKDAKGPADKIRAGELLAYGSGDLGMSVAWSVLGAFTTFYLTNVVGLGAATAGTIILVSKLFDGVSDVAVGALVDRTRTKYGKARPWLIRMALPTGICYFLFFACPDLAEWGKILWVFVTYNLMSTVCYTAVNIPYAALSPLMTRHAPSRVSLNIVRMICAVLSGVIASSATMPVVNALGGGPEAWRLVSGVYAGFMTAMILVAGFLTKERYGAADLAAGRAEEKVPLKVALKALVTNKYWALMTGCLLLFYIVQNAGNGMNVYYFKYILGDENMMGLAAVAGALPVLVGLALMPLLTKRFSKGTLARVSALAHGVFALVLLIDTESLALFLVKCVLLGFAMVPFAAVGFAMLADICDFGYWKSGVRGEGLVNSAASFGIKVGTGIGAASIGWILGLGGFDANLAVQPESAIVAMKVLVIGVPAVLSLAQFALLLFYRLDKQYPQILAELTEREAAAR